MFSMLIYVNKKKYSNSVKFEAPPLFCQKYTYA